MSSSAPSTSSTPAPLARGAHLPTGQLARLRDPLLTPAFSVESPRPEAPPLPRKAGEIGYVPPAQSEPEMRDVNLNEPTLPARHPADRDHAQSPSSSAQTTTAAAAANGDSQPKKIRSWTFGGIHIWSFIRLFLLLGLMGGTAGAWWYTVKHFQDSTTTNQAQGDQGNTQGQATAQGSQATYGWSSTVFVHVAFAIVVLFEFIFLERNIFHIRAERYMFKHGMSPDARRPATLGIAPWNRPPLPSYAAALAESGHGTGDVEDNLSM